MKPTTLTSFIAIALTSAAVFANVIPFGGSHRHSRDVTAFETGGTSPNVNARASSLDNVFRSNTADIRAIDSEDLLSSSILGPDTKSAELIKRTDYDNNNNDHRNETNRRDLQYLNYALFLEELLVAFFERGLSRYSQEVFLRAGYPNWVRGRYEQILEHERIHRDFLRSAITAAGGEYVKPCRYNFYDNDVHAFVDLSEALETIATSAYTGALQFFSNTAYITTGASILGVEARHASWINSAVRKQNPWNTAFETPLTPDQVATLLSTFFENSSCPAENSRLLPPDFRPHPRLFLSPKLIPGEKAEISFQPTNIENGRRLYVAFLTGIETIFVPVETRSGDSDSGREGENRNSNNNKNDNNKNDNKNDHHDEDNHRVRYFVEIPRDLAGRGTVFVILVQGGENIREVNLDENNVVAGPAIASFPFDNNGKPIAW